MLLDQFGNERARHDHALVDIETKAAQPGFVGDVGGRHALVRALFDHMQHGVDFSARQTGVEKRFH